MKDKKTLVAVIGIFIVLLVVLLVWYFEAKGSTASATKPPVKNDETIEKRVFWTQAQLSVSSFTTNEDPEDQPQNDKQAVHIAFTSFFSLSAEAGSTIKDMSVTLVKFTQGVGTPVFIHPPHKIVALERSYTFEPGAPTIHAKDIVDGGKTYKLAITNEQAKYYDELWNVGGMPNFALITKNIGTISEQAILERDNVYESAKVLDYVGVTAEQLDGEIVLDFNITFTDGKKYAKRMKGIIEGTKVLNDDFYTITLQNE
jgi:hypothetical protein